MLDEEFEEALNLGRRNLEVIELVRRHCANAVVEKPAFGGSGMLEAASGLPIDMRTVRCPYARSPAPAGMQLEEIAFIFWRANCRDCEHRQVRDIPNLATVGEQRLAEEARREALAADAEAERDRERRQRAAERAGRVAGEPQSVRDFVALADGVDAEVPDARAKQLVDLARVAPERCSETAGRVLVESASVVLSDDLLEALDWLERAGRVPADPLLAAALWQLSKRPSRTAASIVVRLRAGLRAGDLTPLIPRLVWLAGRSTEPMARSSPYVDGIALAAEVDLTTVLDELCDGLGDVEDERRRGRWAFAAAELIRVNSETALVLAEPIARSLALPGSDSLYAGSPHSGIHDALVAALVARPVEVDETFARVAPTLSEEARKSIFHAYDTALSDHRRGSVELSTEAVTVLVDAIFARLQGDWGGSVAGTAVDALDSISRQAPNLLADRVDAVFGVLLLTVTDGSAGEHPVSGTILRPPNPLAGLEREGRLMMHRANVRRLRDVVGRLSKTHPESTLAGLEAILEAPSSPDNGARAEMQSHATLLLGDIGALPQFAPRVLPRLVSLALGQDVILRTRAIEALGKLNSAPHRNLPADVLELLPGWLSDPYMGPHQAAVQLIREGFPVTDAALNQVIGALVVLARAYASDDQRVLNDVLLATWRLSERLSQDEQAMLQRFVLMTARHLPASDLDDFVEWYAPRTCDPRNLGQLADLQLQVLSDQDRATDPNRRADPILRQLRDRPPEVLAERSQTIVNTASLQLPYVRGALEYIEVLHRAGDYEKASSLAGQVLEYLPDTAEAELVRAGVKAVAAAAEFEFMCTRGDLAAAEAALARWDEALSEREAAEGRRVDPWEMF